MSVIQSSQLAGRLIRNYSSKLSEVDELQKRATRGENVIEELANKNVETKLLIEAFNFTTNMVKIKFSQLDKAASIIA